MLTSLRIRNFKSWRDTGDIRLAPLTVIFGANSAGKSSLGHLLLALKQTALSTDRKRALNLGDSSTLVDLGTFADCIHNHDLNSQMDVDIGWELPQPLALQDAISKTRRSGDALTLHATLQADEKTRQPNTVALDYTLAQAGNVTLSAHVARDKTGKYDLTSHHFGLVKAQGRQWPVEQPEKFYRLSERSIARFQNAGFLTDFALATETMLRNIFYLGPLRQPPQRIYAWSGDTPEDVGQDGRYTVAAILAAESEGRRLNRGPKQSLNPFAAFIAENLKTLGVIDSFTVRPVAKDRREHEVLVRTVKGGAEVKITDIGFGVSQVLPAIVQTFYCPAGSTVWMEQPEIHLHPQVQAELADIFIAGIKSRENGKPRNVQLIVESHSEHFLNRLQRRIAEGGVSPDQVAIYFAQRTGASTELKPLCLNMFGDIENWPDNFFGDDMADLTARTVAAARRRQQEKSA